MPTPLHNQIAQPLLSDKLSQEKRLKAEIAQMRELAKIVREGAYSSDRGQRFHSDGGHQCALMADSFSHALGALPSMS
jgi:hypothetical protein